MALSRWSPMGELAGLHSAMDKLFSDFIGSPLVEDGGGTRTWYLPLDIVDRDDAYQVKAAMPGFNPEDVEVTFADGLLNIKAQRKQESESKDGTYLRRELSFRDFARSIQLPGDIKQADITAGFENGLLTIDIPKVPSPRPVKIPVRGTTKKGQVGAGSEK